MPYLQNHTKIERCQTANILPDHFYLFNSILKNQDTIYYFIHISHLKY